MSKTVPEILETGAATFRERNAIYKDNYKKVGPVMRLIFNGTVPPLRSDEDANRMALLVSIVTKLTRYAETFSEGGHQDSAHDLCVYAAMLEEMTK